MTRASLHFVDRARCSCAEPPVTGMTDLKSADMATRGLVLGVETSGTQGFLALRRNGQLLIERELERARRRHAQTLVSEVQTMLRDHQFGPRDVSRVAVSVGPGSFTGLRVGVVFAKTFAFATGCELVPVDTLAVVAQASPPDVSEVMAVVDAQREELFIGHYQRVSDCTWQRVGDIRILSNAAWFSEIEAKACGAFAVTGPGLIKMRDEVPTSVRVLDEGVWSPRAAHVAELGESLPSLTNIDALSELEPFYLRKSAAEEKRESQQAAAVG